MRPIRILIVDDSPLIRERLVAKLSEIEGIGKINQACNATTAFDTLKKKSPDVVILDIQLSDGSGIDILSRIKKEQPSTTVIMLTNYPYSVIRKKCFNLGADYFFDKSKETDQVFKVIENELAVKTQE